MREKKKITIRALTDKAKEVIKTKEKPKPMEKATIKLFGVKEKIVSEEPFIVETTFKRVPDIVFDQIHTQLHLKFQENGLQLEKDYTLEVE